MTAALSSGPRTIVVKIGGATLKDAPQIAAIAADMVALRERGDHLVIVHGGGPQVTELLERLGTPNPSKAGRRITDAPMLEVVKMVLGGQLNINLALTLRAAGLPIMALSGVSAGIIDGGRYGRRRIYGRRQCIILRVLLYLELCSLYSNR